MIKESPDLRAAVVRLLASSPAESLPAVVRILTLLLPTEVPVESTRPWKERREVWRVSLTSVKLAEESWEGTKSPAMIREVTKP